MNYYEMIDTFRKIESIAIEFCGGVDDRPFTSLYGIFELHHPIISKDINEIPFCNYDKEYFPCKTIQCAENVLLQKTFKEIDL